MRLVLILIMLICSSVGQAQEAKPDKQPKIIVAAPLAVTAGTPIRLVVRGLFLDEITEVKIGATEIKVEVASKGKATIPQNYDARKIGDTQAELKLTLPADTPAGSVQLIAVTATSRSTPYEITVARPEDLIEEKEPNDGFKTAQSVAVGKTIVGTIHDPRNVDVFEIQGTAGQKLSIRVIASQAGSPLDPFLTVYDSAGQVLGGSDDSEGRDPSLEIVLKKTGACFIALQDANDSGGPHFAYLLKIAQ